MTEREWWAAARVDRRDDTGRVDRMIRWLASSDRVSERKFRLFCIACCHRLKQYLPHWPRAKYLELFEEFADGTCDHAGLFARIPPTDHSIVPSLSSDVEPEADYVNLPPGDQVLFLCCASKALDPASGGPRSFPAEVSRLAALYLPDSVVSYFDELTAHAHLLHDIFGPLPFHDSAVPPSWLTSDVLALARGIYTEKAFDRMPILADALQDAGCTNDEVLNHCRAVEWEHVRGCWVVDLLLGHPWREGVS
jgi:hypothetical protein